MTEPGDVAREAGPGNTAGDDPGHDATVAGQSAGADAAGDGDSEGGNLEDKV
ncbi:MAG: hypothetical protein M3N98_05730 [Actinomycetota bacterium]|nr:hypothetical protein [Actinomycetota bacterium]